jgi:pimeloyl-ACP methyl ester carboxylesterase
VLIALLETHALHGCTLSVSCLGAFVGLEVAARRPDLVGKLLLMQVASYEEMRSWSLAEDVCRIIQTPILGQVAMKVGKTLVARQWYHSALPAGADSGPFLRPTLASFRRGACFCLASAFQSFQRGTFGAKEPIPQRTLVVWGGADRTHAGTARESILQHVPHASLLHFPGCGHFPDLENEQAYLELIRFLDNGN